MCTGAELALLAAVGTTVGGSVMQGKAQSRKAEAQTQAADAELQRQRALEGRRAASFEEALELARRENQQQNIDDAAGERATIIQEATGLPQQVGDYESPAVRGTPRVVQNYADQQQGQANDLASRLGLARAQMGAWGEGMMPFTLGFQDAAFDMDEMGRRMGESARIGALEAQNAFQNTANRTAMGGNLAVQLGQMGMQAAGGAGGADRLGPLFNTGAPGGVPTGGYYSGGPGGLY